MATQAITLTGYDGTWSGAVLLDSTLIAGGETAYLRYVERVGASIRVRLAATATADPTDAGPDFTDVFEMATAAFTFVEAGGSSITLKGPGNPDNTFVDPSDPYFWTPDNNSAWGTFNASLGSGVVTLTLNDGAGGVDDLVLADFDQTGLLVDMLALIEAGAAPDVFSRPPRGTNGTLLDPDNSDLEIDSSGEPVNAIRFRDQGSDAGGERISFHDNGNLNLRDYFDTGGLGSDLTLWVQTATDTISFAVADQFDRGGSNFAIFDVPAADQAVVAGIASGDRFIIALTRPASAAVIELAANIAAGAPAIAANLSVTAVGVVSLAANVEAGTPEIAGDLSVTPAPAVSLAADIAAGTPAVAGNLSVTAVSVVSLAANIQAGTPAITSNLRAIGGVARLAADILAGPPAVRGQLWIRDPLGTVQLRIDRDGDGAFTEPGEDVTGDVLADTGIRSYRGGDVSVPLTPPRVGDFQVELRNDSNEYSPGSTVRAGRPVQLRIDGQDTWRGYLDRPTQHPEYGRQSVSLSGFGIMYRLRGVTVTTALYSGISVHEALEHVLDAAGWPAADRDIAQNSQTVLEWFWAEEQDAWTVIQMLFRSEGPGALLAEGVAGQIVFRGRRFLVTNLRATTTQASFNSTGSPPIGRRLQHDDGEEHVINSAAAVSVRRSAKAIETIWEFPEQVNLASNEVWTITAQTAADSPFMSAVTPVANIDYTLLSGSLRSVALSRTAGQSTTLALTAGNQGAQLTGLQVRAAPVTIDSQTVITDRRNETASIDQYGRRALPDSYVLSPDIRINVLQSLIDAIVSWYAAGRPRVAVPTYNLDQPTRAVQVGLRLGDRISVTGQAGDIQISGLFNVYGIEQRIKTTDYLETVFYGDESVDVPYAAWDIGQWDTGQWGF